MTEQQLGIILKEMYNSAPNSEKVAHIHLFGIKYADIIISNHSDKKEIIRVSGISTSYLTELSKGVKLAKYLKLK